MFDGLETRGRRGKGTLKELARDFELDWEAYMLETLQAEWELLYHHTRYCRALGVICTHEACACECHLGTRPRCPHGAATIIRFEESGDEMLVLEVCRDCGEVVSR